MRKVTLAKSIRFPGDRLRLAGEVVEVDDGVFAEFVGRGVFVTGAPKPSEPVERQREPEADAEAVPEPAGGAPQRPRKAAALDAWRAYATAKGVDPKGMTKAELIAAVG
ncbi:hypothetical protein [Corynebacterium sp. 239_CJEI]|uniref:hypothetical protein n=1 Tax=Corynebacterium sp. 239_CJEI TaxID=2715674 RepID=UPI0006680777|nr:hypothetical protein [Corynebacterium sp. 239_CJEI]MDK7248585.1 hypothetical protein [Corynebacterium amycolatum]